MFNLFRKKRDMPAFNDLKNSALKDRYFIRLAPWGWMNDKMIYVTDLNSPRIITMDPWPQTIYLKADGQSTIEELVFEMAAMYGRNEEIPGALDKTVLDVIESLLNDKLIELTDTKRPLPNHLASPINNTN